VKFAAADEREPRTDRILVAVNRALVRDLEKGPPLSRVARVSVRWLPATGRFAGFDIRYAEFES